MSKRLKSIVVRTYKSSRSYERDARRMAGRGYKIQSVTSQTRNPGFMRFITLGLFALVFKPRPILVATYELVQA